MLSAGRKVACKYIIERFKRGAIAAHFGYQDEDKAMQLAGVRAATRAAEMLDVFGPEGRMTLVPLLDDPDWGIRVFAAGYLVKVMPERALAALQDLEDRCPVTEARMTAYGFLLNYRLGKLDR